jgi:hypothetical protein
VTTPLAPSARPPRRHRRLTTPSGVLLFACLALPGYRECGHSHAMTSDPILVATCSFGVLAAVLSLVIAAGRWERWVAIAVVVGAVLAAGLIGLACGSYEQVYAGLSLAAVTSASLVVGALAWQYEARDHAEIARQLVRWTLPLAIVALAGAAVFADWQPGPDDPPPNTNLYFGPH